MSTEMTLMMLIIIIAIMGALFIHMCNIRKHLKNLDGEDNIEKLAKDAIERNTVGKISSIEKVIENSNTYYYYYLEDDKHLYISPVSVNRNQCFYTVGTDVKVTAMKTINGNYIVKQISKFVEPVESGTCNVDVA